MIGISKLYCGTVEASDPLRYGRKAKDLPSHLLQFSEDKKPIVVWNTTRRCNLSCVHCYSQSANRDYEDELTTDEGLALLDNLGEFGAPVVLFSGGEPLMRKDLLTLIEHAKKVGMRAVISTNGTLIDQEKADRFAELGLSYVGISLDGMRETNDKFRGHQGAYDQAIQGIRNCKKAGVKVGLRFTINKRNAADIPQIFDLLVEEDIPRVCFYHLVYAGRGSNIMQDDLDHEETRKVVDLIIDRTNEMHKQGIVKEVLTVDNHADGPYLYMRLLEEENHERADEVRQLLKMNQGNSTGIGIACVSWDGQVHADQFWRHYSFGNVRDRKFSDIWMDVSDPLMAKLKNRKGYLEGRCAPCRFVDVCNGNFRVRAEAATDSLWLPDPACYLSDEEISGEPL
ncbi:MAG: 12,18-didecarboxysiroheme deacetylase [Planctomycetes bacterium]|nr:12,18-didecarboxysiroheme deacetylase [Planctomycetota bacterium]